jgi:hypothetical protein
MGALIVAGENPLLTELFLKTLIPGGKITCT